jgi:hypothetical protein
VCLLLADALLAAQVSPPAATSPNRPTNYEKIDDATIARIRDEGLKRSQVMDHLGWLADVYGPRITGSPSYKQASEWARQRLTSWGLVNVHEEAFPFGKGWSLVRFNAHIVEPQTQTIIGNPRGWSPSTAGAIVAEVAQAVIRNEEDFGRYRGKLRGKIVLSQPMRQVRLLQGPIVLRMNERDLADAKRLPNTAPSSGRTGVSREAEWELRVQKFFLSEGVVAVLDRDRDEFIVNATGIQLDGQVQRTDGGTVFITRLARPESDHSQLVPTATIAVEHYNRMLRVMARGIPVKVELDIQTAYHDAGEMDGTSIFAEIPGTDRINSDAGCSDRRVIRQANERFKSNNTDQTSMHKVLGERLTCNSLEASTRPRPVPDRLARHDLLSPHQPST